MRDASTSTCPQHRDLQEPPTSTRPTASCVASPRKGTGAQQCWLSCSETQRTAQSMFTRVDLAQCGWLRQIVALKTFRTTVTGEQRPQIRGSDAKKNSCPPCFIPLRKKYPSSQLISPSIPQVDQTESFPPVSRAQDVAVGRKTSRRHAAINVVSSVAAARDVASLRDQRERGAPWGATPTARSLSLILTKYIWAQTKRNLLANFEGFVLFG